MKIYFSAAQIADAVARIAREINAYYAEVGPEERVTVVASLKGAAIFFADLVRKLNFPLEIDFVRATSYGNARESSGDVRLTKDVETPLKGKRVLIVEDLVDSGRTLAALRRHFIALGASEVKSAVLVKKLAPRAEDAPVDFYALEAENLYLVGYGLDDAENGLQLPDIWVVEEPAE